MFELVKAGGWVMWPIILCSVAAMAIVGERLWSLQRKRIAPATLLENIKEWLHRQELDQPHLAALHQNSPLGRVLAAGLSKRQHDRQAVKEAIEDAGRHAAQDLERYLNTLGTIAAISPFLGLLGTVLGMIQMFSGLGTQGVGDPSIIARGIGQALITTASGLAVAIPSLMFYRYFRGRVNALLLDMEHEATKLLDLLSTAR